MSEKLVAAVRCKNRKEFYDRTRNGKIEALCEDIRKNTHKGKNNGEQGAWKNSLPDFAELLYAPESYRERFLQEAEPLLGKIDDEINIWKYVLDKLETGDIGEALDHSSSDKYRSIVCPVKDILTHLEDQKKKQQERLDYIRENPEVYPEVDSEEDPLKGVRVDIEYPVADTENPDIIRRIDVLISNPDKNKYVIVELKQWTENNICSAEDGKFQIGSYPTEHEHPVKKVKEIYRECLIKHLKEKLGINVDYDDIRCIVYLHNQMYINGILHEVAKEQNINIYEDYSGDHNAILYTKPWHGALLAKLHMFFD